MTHAPDQETLKEYDLYFDDCERANKIPLTFDKWRALHAAQSLEYELDYRAHNHD